MKHYGVRNTTSTRFHRVGKVVKFYPTKEEAKTVRASLNGVDKDGDEALDTGWVVTARYVDGDS